MPVIKTDNLGFQYRSGRGIEGITFSVERGECFSLLGRNGSGKSTLTRLIMGLEKRSSGELKVLGHDPSSASPKYLHRTGCALDRCAHWENLSGWKNAWFFARSYEMVPKAINRRLRELFVLADLWDRSRDPVKNYSYGMRRKLTLLEAFCHDPELLVLDEPTAGVDAHFLNRLADLVRRRTDEGLTTWIAGNDPDWLSGITTGLAFIDSGRITAKGTEEEFLKELSPFQKVNVRLRHYIDLPAPSGERITTFKQSGREITIIMEKDPMLIPFILEWIVSQGGEVSDLEVRRGTLRDAFLKKTGARLEASNSEP